MDCQAFDSSLLDALYDELDAPTSSAMDEHAAGCESCRVRFAQLTKTQEQIRPLLEPTPLPDGFEDRILAAAHAAMDASAASAGAKVVRLSDRRAASSIAKTDEAPQAASKPGGGGVIAFLSRPQFAIAAAFVLVLGAAALFINTTSSRSASMSASKSEPASAPAAPAPIAASGAPLSFAENAATPPPPSDLLGTAAPITTATTMPTTMASGALALADPSDDQRARRGPLPGPAPAARPAKASAEADEAKLASPSGGGGGGSNQAGQNQTKSGDPTFVAAKSLYDTGRYGEALPKFESLAASNPEAELYVARCLANTKGCDAAAPRYDNVTKRTAGSSTASAAALEAARCYGSHNQATAARTRYQKLQNDKFVSNEANTELESLEAPRAKATVKAAKPPPPATGTTTARPVQVDDNAAK